MVNKLSAYKIYLLFSAITAMCFSLTATVMIVYHIGKVHLNPLQLIFVGTTLETACFILVTPVLALYIISMIMDKKVVDRVGGGDYEENN
ncbi:hypothetical protein BCD93_001162 [Clostridium saccharoperbutylacetonicum]|nr:hypothetical protein [Clostridium saccharoperbutylacetonicum]